MRNKIRKTILRAIAAVLSFIPKKTDECILLSSHIPVQNLGDQALLAGSIEGLKCYKRIHIIQTGSDSQEKAVDTLRIGKENLIFVKRFYIVFASGKAFKELIAFLFYVSRYKFCFAIGADVLDGTYNKSEVSAFFDVINLVAKCNVQVTVVGSSFSKNISNETMRGMSSLDRCVRFYCRDVYSLQRIERFFPAKLSADAAFLMKPSESISAYGDQKKLRYLKRNRSVIGICLKENDLPNERSLQEFCLMLSSLKFGDLSPVYVCLPHHPKDLKSCHRIHKSMSNPDRFFMPAYLPAANEIKAIAQICDIVVTGRMHVAIAALSVSAIPVCYSYGDKFSGLMKHFDLEDIKLIVGEGDEDIKSILLRCDIQKNEIKEIICRRREVVLGKARLNFIDGC